MQWQAAEISDGEPCAPPRPPATLPILPTLPTPNHPKPPPHHIDGRLYLLSTFPAISPWKFGAGGAKRDELSSPLLSVFNYNVCNGSSARRRGTMCVFMSAPHCLEESKQHFSGHDKQINLFRAAILCVAC